MDAHAAAAAPGAAAHESHPSFNPWLIFVALVILTGVSWGADKMTLSPNVTGSLVMLVSTIKASLVVAYFMHFKFEGTWKYVLTIPPIVMAILLACALAPDVGLRNNSWTGQHEAK